MKPIFIFLLFSICVQVSAQTEIVWKENMPLTWNDFKGPKRNSKLAAETYCSINTSVAITGDKLNITIQAVFYADSSWYNPEKIHELTLTHEQGHFQIAELYARKLRKAVAEKINSFTDYQNQFEALYEEVHGDYFDRQEQYDEETLHGTISRTQMDWIDRIAEELLELKEYQL